MVNNDRMKKLIILLILGLLSGCTFATAENDTDSSGAPRPRCITACIDAGYIGGECRLGECKGNTISLPSEEVHCGAYQSCCCKV